MEISGDKFRRNAFCIPGYATSMCVLFVFNARGMQLHASLGGCCVQTTLENTATLVSERRLVFAAVLFFLYTSLSKGEINLSYFQSGTYCYPLGHWR